MEGNLPERLQDYLLVEVGVNDQSLGVLKLANRQINLPRQPYYFDKRHIRLDEDCSMWVNIAPEFGKPQLLLRLAVCHPERSVWHTTVLEDPVNWDPIRIELEVPGVSTFVGQPKVGKEKVLITLERVEVPV